MLLVAASERGTAQTTLYVMVAALVGVGLWDVERRSASLQCDFIFLVEGFWKVAPQRVIDPYTKS